VSEQNQLPPAKDHQGDTDWEDPLQRERNTPGPRIVHLVICVGRRSHDNPTDGPRHLEGGRAGASQGDGDNLASVSGSVGNEKPPRNTFKCLTNHQHGKGVSLGEWASDASSNKKSIYSQRTR